jgi:hypothetical protein
LPNRHICFFNENHNPNPNVIERNRKAKKSSPEVTQSPKTDRDSGGSERTVFVVVMILMVPDFRCLSAGVKNDLRQGGNDGI